VTMSGPEAGEVVVVDNDDGTYTVKCSATKALSLFRAHCSLL